MSLMRSPIVRRWIDILILSTFLLALGVMLQAPLSQLLQRWTNYYSALAPLVSYTGILFIGASLTVALIRLGALGVQFGVMTMLRYPPSWFAAIIVSVVVGVLMIQREGADTLVLSNTNLFHFAGIVVVFALGVLFGFLYHRLEVLRSSPELLRKLSAEHACQIRHIFDNDDDLLDWVFRERPIRHPNHDMFGRFIPARRIARLLGKKAPSSIGIVGPFGSGKSSFVNLVEYYLKHPPPECANDPSQQFSGKIILCRIDGWGRTSGTVAQKILFLAIEEVKKYVDCVSVIALPENYHKAIAGARSVGGAFISVLLQSPQDPVSQLCRLDKILAAANLRLIIVLEDLDRNVSAGIIGDEMPALLDRLRILNNVSFVLAIGTERNFSHILIRICDHVEAIS